MKAFHLKEVLLAFVLLSALLLAKTLLFSGRALRLNEAGVVVEVRNGCGAGGLGDDVARYLRDKGFDVIFVGNAEDFEFEETMVVDRCGDPAKAREVARALGDVEVVRQVSSAALADVTVVVGRDFEKRSL
jgi:hypothetical protein